MIIYDFFTGRVSIKSGPKWESPAKQVFASELNKLDLAKLLEIDYI